MKQSIQLSSDKSFVKFSWSPVIDLRDLLEGQFLRILDAIKPNKPFYNQALVIVEETLEKLSGGARRPRHVAKGVLLSEDLWNATIAASPAMALNFTVANYQDAFLMLQDCVERLMLKLAPIQERKTFSTVITGDVNFGFKFVESTLKCTPALTPTTVDGDAGVVTFDLADYGTNVALSVVTQPHYIVLRVIRTTRTVPQLSHSHFDTTIPEDPWGVIIHPSLATILGITYPAIS
jgi:hypothetical protein